MAMASQDERPRPGQLHDEHRVRPARLPLPGGVDLATAWAASTTTCRRSSSCPTRRGLPYNKRGNFSVRLPADGPPGHDHQRRPRPTPIADLFPPERPRVHHAGERGATGLDLLAELNRGHAAEQPGRLAARGADRVLRAGRADAAQRARGARPVAARPTATRAALRPRRRRRPTTSAAAA